MVTLVFANVVLRYVFNSGIYWSQQAFLVIVIWFTFIAFALGVKEDLHISINILPKKTPSAIVMAVVFFKYAVEIFCGGILFVYGIKLTRVGTSSVLPAMPHYTNRRSFSERRGNLKRSEGFWASVGG